MKITDKNSSMQPNGSLPLPPTGAHAAGLAELGRRFRALGAQGQGPVLQRGEQQGRGQLPTPNFPKKKAEQTAQSAEGKVRMPLLDPSVMASVVSETLKEGEPADGQILFGGSKEPEHTDADGGTILPNDSDDGYSYIDDPLTTLDDGDPIASILPDDTQSGTILVDEDGELDSLFNEAVEQQEQPDKKKRWGLFAPVETTKQPLVTGEPRPDVSGIIMPEQVRPLTTPITNTEMKGRLPFNMAQNSQPQAQTQTQGQAQPQPQVFNPQAGEAMPTDLFTGDLPEGLVPDAKTLTNQATQMDGQTQATRPSLNEMADRIAKHLMASAPGADKPEVRIQLKDSVFPKTQLQVVREDGYLTVRVMTASGEVHGMMRESLQGLRDQLEQRLGEDVQMELHYQGEDGEGRSRGYHRYEEYLEGDP